MGGLPRLPDGAFSNQHCSRNLKLEDDVSPKSVIADIRFISPSSSSSSSIDPPHFLPDANLAKLDQPHHDRGYSISDGESSDPDNTKVCTTSRSLEPLREAHVEATKTADDLTGSASSRRLNIQVTGVSSQDAPSMQSRRDGENRGTSDSTVRSVEFGVTNPFENPGSSPLRSFPMWQSQSLGSHISLSRSPGFEKSRIGSLSPGSSMADQLHRGMIPFQHRFLSGPLHAGISHRPSPSKWDDAEKWIASPVQYHESSAQPQLLPRPQQLLQTGRRLCHQPICGGGSPDFSTRNITTESEKPLSPTFPEPGRVESENHKQVASDQKKRSKALSFGDVSKRAFDVSCSNASQAPNCQALPGRLEGTGISGECESPENAAARWFPDKVSNMDEEILKHIALTEPIKEIGSHQLQSSCQVIVDRLPPVKSSGRFGRQNLDSSECQQNSTRTTPMSFTASPARHNTPAAARSDDKRPAASFGSFTKAGLLELQTWHLAKLELCKLPCDDRNMELWSTREEEDKECFVRLRDDHGSDIKGCVVTDDKLAAAWEDAEQTKCHDHERCDEDEARINAWEEFQTSWAEAEMHKIEVKIEKMRARALEKMTNRIASARKKAKEMRDAAHARRVELAAKTAQQGQSVAPVPKSPLIKGCFRS